MPLGCGTGFYFFSLRPLPTCPSNTIINLVYLLFCSFSWILQRICWIAQRSRKWEDDDGRSLTLGLERRSWLTLGIFFLSSLFGVILLVWVSVSLLPEYYKDWKLIWLFYLKFPFWEFKGKSLYSFQRDKTWEDIIFGCWTYWQKLWSSVFLNKLSICVFTCF